MKERPILFSGDMVRATMAGKKTQTRRVIKLPAIQQTLEVLDIVEHGDEWLLKVRDENLFVAHLGDKKLRIKSPYGKPGDRLWVRESIWRYHCIGGPPPRGLLDYQYDSDMPISYRNAGGWLPEGFKKIPARYMPRWASRITLEVTGVSVERLQDISVDDALEEGVDAVSAYASLWDSINANRPGCSWGDNPWVWVVEFKRVDNQRRWLKDIAPWPIGKTRMEMPLFEQNNCVR